MKVSPNIIIIKTITYQHACYYSARGCANNAQYALQYFE